MASVAYGTAKAIVFLVVGYAAWLLSLCVTCFLESQAMQDICDGIAFLWPAIPPIAVYAFALWAWPIDASQFWAWVVTALLALWMGLRIGRACGARG